MTDIAGLSFSIDSSGSDKAKQSLDAMAASAQQAAIAAQKLVEAQAKQIAQLQTLVAAQSQVSQGHSNMAATVMPLAGALAIGAGSFTAVNFAMNSFTNMLTNQVSGALDNLNQKMRLSFTLMGSLGIGSPNQFSQMFQGALSQGNINGLSPMSQIGAQYTGVTLGLNSQTSSNMLATIAQERQNPQTMALLQSYGVNTNANANQQMQQLVQNMAMARPSQYRTQDAAMMGITPDQLNASIAQQRLLSVRTPYERWSDNQTINSTQNAITSQANSNNWGIYAANEYGTARSMDSAFSEAAIKGVNAYNNSWAGRFWNSGPNLQTYRNNNAAIDNFTNVIGGRAAIGTQDLFNHITNSLGLSNAKSYQSWGQDIGQAVGGELIPIYGAEEHLRNWAGFGINSNITAFNNRAPNPLPSQPGTAELNKSVQTFAENLDQIAPAADQIANIRNGWVTLNAILGGKDGKSLSGLLNGYPDANGNIQPGLKQYTAALPNGADLFKDLSSIVKVQVQDSKNAVNSGNPLTYNLNLQNAAQMQIAGASSRTSGELLSAQYSALQQMGIDDPTTANLASMQGNSEFQAQMRGYNQSGTMANQELINQGNATTNLAQFLNMFPANDPGTRTSIAAAAMNPGTNLHRELGGNLKPGDLKNYLSSPQGKLDVAAATTGISTQELMAAQTQLQQSNVATSGLYAAIPDFRSGNPNSLTAAQIKITAAQITATTPGIAQGDAIAAATNQINAQQQVRFAASQGQDQVASQASRIMTDAYGDFNNFGSNPQYGGAAGAAVYNIGLRHAQAASQVGLETGSFTQPQQDTLIQGAEMLLGNKEVENIQSGMKSIQLGTNQAQYMLQNGGNTSYSQQMANFTFGLNSPGVQLPDGVYQSDVNAYGQNLDTQTQFDLHKQLIDQNQQNYALKAQAGISPFLNPTQQAMQLGQQQILQSAGDKYNLSPTDPALLKKPGVQDLITANNEGIADQQKLQRQQQVTNDIQNMSDTVVTSLEKLATGGYNTSYILRAAASNIAGEGANALVFQPLTQAISGTIGNVGSLLTGGSATAIQGGGIFGSIANKAFGFGANTNNSGNGNGGRASGSGGMQSPSFLSDFFNIASKVVGLVGLSGFGAGDSGFTGAGGSMSASSLAAHQGAVGADLALARGGVFSRGNVMPFASGDVFDQPTNFPMAGGMTGLMGEAGPEAIVPLKRGPDGKLGISSSGNQAQSGASIVIHAPISVQGGQNGKMTAAQQADMQAQLTATLHAAVKSVIVNEQRNGGTLSGRYNR